MIGQLIRAVVVGVLGFSVLCAVAILSAQRPPAQTDLFDYLNRCNDQVCYLGVAPGKTGWEDTIATFQAAPIKFDSKTNVAWEPLGFQGRLLLFGYPPQGVSNIDLVMPSPTLKIGDFILRFGRPCAVVVPLDFDIGVIFTGMEVVVQDNSFDKVRWLQPDGLVSEINLIDEARSCDFHPSDIIPKRYSWQGFTRYAS